MKNNHFSPLFPSLALWNTQCAKLSRWPLLCCLLCLATVAGLAVLVPPPKKENTPKPPSLPDILNKLLDIEPPLTFNHHSPGSASAVAYLYRFLIPTFMDLHKNSMLGEKPYVKIVIYIKKSQVHAYQTLFDEGCDTDNHVNRTDSEKVIPFKFEYYKGEYHKATCEGHISILERRHRPHIHRTVITDKQNNRSILNQLHNYRL